MTRRPYSDSQHHIAVRGDAFLMEMCRCGKHPRIMPAWVLVAAWRQGRTK